MLKAGRTLPIVVGLIVAGCDLMTAPPTTLDPVSTLPIATTTATEPTRNTVVIPLAPFSEMGPGWAEIFMPYGDDETTLGAATGAGGVVTGPAYGTQTPDGRWWLLDTAKRRVARFTNDGEYIDQVEMTGETLLAGNFAFLRPVGLNDNTVVAYRLDGPSTSVLRVFDEGFSLVTVPQPAPWSTSDGVAVYGDHQAGSLWRLDPWAGVLTDTDWFVGRAGQRFRLTAFSGEILVELPDAGIETTLQIRLAEQPEIEVRFDYQVATGADGSLFILVHGSPLSDETLVVGGLLTMDSDGRVTRVQPITNPTTTADRETPAQLGVTPGTANPWLMVIEPEGVRIHVRVN